MDTFCTDVDLLHWEPQLFKEAAFVSQTLLTGTGDLAGTSFTLDSGSLTAAHVVAGHVIRIAGAVNGSFPIVSVDSATAMTVSALYDRLFPDEGAAVPTPAGTASDVAFSIRTFWPQRRVTTELLLSAVGLSPAEFGKVVSPLAMKRACILGTLQMAYSTLAAAAAEPANYSTRADLYERLFRRALRAARVEIDLNGDGQADCVRSPGVLRFERD